MSFEKNRVFSLFLPSWNHWERKREVEIIWDLSLFFSFCFLAKVVVLWKYVSLQSIHSIVYT